MKKTFKIKGMHCASCSKIVEMELQGKVNSCSVNFASGKAIIDFDPKTISEDKIKDLIKGLGYGVE